MQGRDKELLIKNWLLKSDEAMDDAKIAVGNNRLSTTQNRLYYAIFYAISALAQKYGFATSKHGQLLGWFNREFIKTNKVEEKYGKLYIKTFDNRQRSDYTITFQPDKQALISDIHDTEEFIKVIKQLAE
ncbi:MAG: hypothetical protein A2Y25_10980 [Candidatus Melainabacteria bacterium GWF2_37_15]|nr:MAG: hypothetical protein A2Y25_10980 [Candidatus Melainabacteria bacterium GWF2_37_15]